MERHRTDTVSLIFGLLFTAGGIVGLTSAIELSSADVRWIAPSLLVVIGVLLVLPIGRSKPKDRYLETETAIAASAPTAAVSAPAAPVETAPVEEGFDAGGSEAAPPEEATKQELPPDEHGDGS